MLLSREGRNPSIRSSTNSANLTDLEARREDRAHLRTRVPQGGMDYKGYNVAMHELGHNVEQVFSLYEVDHTLLAGVPNNAFTEALKGNLIELPRRTEALHGLLDTHVGFDAPSLN